MTAPLWFRWDGEALRPMDWRLLDRMRSTLTSGEICQVSIIGDRNMKAHGLFFAIMRKAWESLPEADRLNTYPSPEHLRKWALTLTPYCSMRHYYAATPSEAGRVLKFLAGDDARYSRVVLTGKTITVYTPDSQAIAAMPDNKIFQASMSAVFDVLAQHLGIAVEELKGAA